MPSRQLPLQGAQIVGIMYAGPIRFDMEIAIDEISYVHVPGNPSSLRSYWQIPNLPALTRSKQPWLNQGYVQLVPRTP